MLDYTAANLVLFDGFKQGLEIALAKALVALALDEHLKRLLPNYAFLSKRKGILPVMHVKLNARNTEGIKPVSARSFQSVNVHINNDY